MGVKYKVLREHNEDDKKFAPQEAIVRDAIFKSAGGVNGETSRDDVIALIDSEGNLETKQGTAKIVMYYQRTLEQRRIIDVVKAVKAKTEKTEETEDEASEESEEEEAA